MAKISDRYVNKIVNSVNLETIDTVKVSSNCPFDEINKT